MKNKIRVVLFQPYIAPYRNELFNQINDYQDIDLYVVYISNKTEDRQWQDKLNSSFKEIQIKCTSRKVSYEKNIDKLSIFDFLKVFYKLNPDVIISQLSKYTVLLKLIFFWRHTKLIHWSEATLITEKGKNQYKKYLEWFFNYPSAYVFPGRLSMEYHATCGLPIQNKFFYAPNSVDQIFSVDPESVTEKFKCIDKIKLLFVGSFITLKGFDILNESFKFILSKYKNLEIHVAGGGPISPISQVINHGFLRKEETAKLYKECHIFIMPSLWDCNPLSAIEAAKCGCILLLSDGVGNYPELVNGNGEVFVRGRVEALIMAIENIINKPEKELRDMGKLSLRLSSQINHTNSAKAFYNAIRYTIDK